MSWILKWKPVSELLYVGAFTNIVGATCQKKKSVCVQFRPPFTLVFVWNVIICGFPLGWIRIHLSQLPLPVLQSRGRGLCALVPSSPSVTMIHLSLLSCSRPELAVTFPFRKYVLLPIILLCIETQLLTSRMLIHELSGLFAKHIVNMLQHTASLMMQRTHLPYNLSQQGVPKAYV